MGSFLAGASDVSLNIWIGGSVGELVGRFAPSPTGVLHLGNLRTALASWLSVKSRGGRWILRIEDVDRSRSRSEFAEQQVRDLAILGLESDGAVIWQSSRDSAYRAALEVLHNEDLLYSCGCTRKDLAMLASAPHLEDGLRPYPGTCWARHCALALSGHDVGDQKGTWGPKGVGVAAILDTFPDELHSEALRFHLPQGELPWSDLVMGAQRDDPSVLTGDPLLHRRDGCFAYHLAVVVDDAEQGVTEVVRGNDLRSVTATQIRLQEALDFPRPVYAHVALVALPDGVRLGKRGGALGVQELEARGILVPEIVGWLGYSLGCLSQPELCSAEDLVEHFSWERVPDREAQAACLQSMGEWIGRIKK